MLSRSACLSEDRPFFTRIEGLRGLGAMAVAGYHFTGYCLHGFALLQPSQWPVSDPIQCGLAYMGLFLLPGHAFLMMFFVISGLVLRLSLENGPQTAGAASGRFLISRLFRFYPIVIVAVLLSVLFPINGMNAENLTASRLAANLLLIDVSLNGHLWALQLELLMVPVILALYFLERRWGAWAVLGIALTTTVLSFSTQWAIWRPLSTNLFAFVLGMTIPTLGRRFVTGLSSRAAITLLGITGAVLLMTGPCLGVYSKYSTILEAYAATLALSIVVYRPDLSILRWLDCRYLNRLGAAAGSYYVLHMVMAMPLLTLTTRALPASWSIQVPGLIGIAVLALWLVALVPLMICASRFVEMPGVALGRRLICYLGLVAVRSKPIPVRQAPCQITHAGEQGTISRSL